MVDLYPWITLAACVLGSALFYFVITSMNTIGG